MNAKQSGKILIGDSGKYPNLEEPEGWSVWIENGIYFKAKTVDPKLFGRHSYEQTGTGMCECGCNMWSSSSSGPVDPFGACPNNPNPFTTPSEK